MTPQKPEVIGIAVEILDPLAPGLAGEQENTLVRPPVRCQEREMSLEDESGSSSTIKKKKY